MFDILCEHRYHKIDLKSVKINGVDYTNARDTMHCKCKEVKTNDKQDAKSKPISK